MTDGKVIDTSDEEMSKLFVEAIKSKKIIIFPCETVYVLGFDYFDENLRNKVYEIKKRPKEKKISATIPSPDYLSKVGIIPNKLEKKFMQKYWPGQLKIAFSPEFACHNAEDEWLVKTLKQLDTIVATTSANISGNAEVRRAKDLEKELVEKAGLVLVGDEKIRYQKNTTIVRLKGKIEILRQGVINITNKLGL